METVAVMNMNDLRELMGAQHAELREALAGSLSAMAIDGFCNRYRDVLVSPEEVARMHSVHKSTVIEYIKDGTIAAEQSKKYGEYHIRLSDALRLDFKKLRQQLRRQQSKRKQ